MGTVVYKLVYKFALFCHKALEDKTSEAVAVAVFRVL